MSQSACPWDVRFAPELPHGSPFAPRVASGNVGSGVEDARTLARELLAMSQAEFSAAFERSPMRRAKRRGLARNAAVALGNVDANVAVPAAASRAERRAERRRRAAPSPACQARLA